MLLSQRIAQDPSFLERANFRNHPIFKNPTFFDIRLMIINAVKFIVGQELLVVDGIGGDQIDAVSQLIYRQSIEDIDASSRSNLKAGLDKQIDLYHEYAKMPYPLIVLENDIGMFLLVQTDRGFKSLSIGSKGDILPLWVHSDIIDQNVLLRSSEEVADDCNVYLRDLIDGSQYTARAKIDRENCRLVDVRGYCQTVMAMECLLFINVANTRVPVYSPTKRELKAVPSVLQPKFTYRVLDIFRDRKEYHSLDEVKSVFGRQAEETIHRRAHLVRGHFKQIKGKLYWWNSFMRNRRNLDSMGFVDKDYQLN